MNKEERKLYEYAMTYESTCSIFHLRDKSILFIRKGEYLSYLKDTDKELLLIVPFFISDAALGVLPSNVKIYRLDGNIEYVFTLIHNKMHEGIDPTPNIIGDNCQIHETALIGIDGKKFVTCPDGSRLQLKHIGNVIIEDNVEIEPYCIIHRASMTSTIIRKGAKICAGVNVGHNAVIGENTVICPGALIGGTCIIGRNVFIGQGASIRDHRNICDYVDIGQSSVVLKDIMESGVYVGNPARFLKPLSKSLKPYDKRRYMDE